jgi:hypothetical protein
MSNLQDLPNELIQEVLSRSNLDEIHGLCNSNARFRAHCNNIGERLLKSRFPDMYHVYVLTKLFSICINTDQGQTFFAKTDNIKKIPKIFAERIKDIAIDESLKDERYDLAWIIDSDINPTTMSLHFNFYHEPEKNFHVVISGDLVSYRDSEKLVDYIEHEFQLMLKTI